MTHDHPTRRASLPAEVLARVAGRSRPSTQSTPSGAPGSAAPGAPGVPGVPGAADIPTWSEVLAVARELEASGVDLLDLAAPGTGRSAVSDPDTGDIPGAARWPYEPTTLATALLRSTERVRVVLPLDATGTAPYHFARSIATLDYAGPGRIVLEATRPEDDDARARQDEYLAVVERLWHSWTRDAIIADQQTGQFFDPTQVRDIDVVGQHFSVRGALNLPEPPGPFPTVLLRGAAEVAA